MRNKKNLKGFTLVELIVVMAIIGVLAAVLVPSMLSFMKDSKISAANQNARTFNTAVTAWLTKEVASNDNASDFASVTLTTGAAVDRGSANAVNLTGALDVHHGQTHLTAAAFRTRLDDSFYGWANAVVSANGSSVQFATWAASTDPGKTQITAAAQDALAAGSPVVGCHPLG